MPQDHSDQILRAEGDNGPVVKQWGVAVIYTVQIPRSICCNCGSKEAKIDEEEMKNFCKAQENQKMQRLKTANELKKRFRMAVKSRPKALFLKIIGKLLSEKQLSKKIRT